MRNIFILCLLAILFCNYAYSQNFELKGKVLDMTDSTPVIGSTVQLFPKSDSTNPLGTVSDENGLFHFSHLGSGYYSLQVNYVGAQPFSQSISIVNTNVNLGIVMLQPNHMLEDVVIKGRMERVQQLGDTTQFSADAFKVNPDASAEDLIQKMPGVVADNEGIKVNGETVTKIYVDGKPFFGNDPAIAMKNLPAEMIDKIQVFDKQSDQAEFTGFDDGNAEKTINIVTKRNKNHGLFGKLYAGAGTDSKYAAGGSINSFGGSARLTVLGLSNNINQQNFSGDALSGISSGRSKGSLMTRGRSGITKTNSVGVNYSDEWGEKVKLSGSYFYNNTNNVSERSLYRQYYQDTSFTYTETSSSENKGAGHRFNLRLEYNIDSNNTIYWRPSLNYQSNDNTSTLMAMSDLGSLGGRSNINNQKQSYSNNFSQANEITFNHKFRKRGRTISFDFQEQTGSQTGNGKVYSVNKYTDSSTLLDQRYAQSATNKQLSGSIRYTEPISKTSQLMVNYNPSYSNNERDKSTNDYDNTTDNYDSFNTLLSNKYDNLYVKQRAGLNYRFRQEKLRFMVGINAQTAYLKGNQDFPEDFTLEKRFTNYLPIARLNYQPNKGENLRIDYRTSTDAPSISQLQRVVDISNPLLLNTGNPDLQQSMEHRIRLRYGKTNTETEHSFHLYAGVNVEQDHISNARFIPQQDTVFMDVPVNKGGQISIPVNLDGYVSSNANATYSFPVDAISCNMNIGSGVNYGRSPSLVNNNVNYSSSVTPNMHLVLSSNINENVDFTLSYRGSYNFVSNTAQTNVSNNYYNQNLSLNVNFILLSHLVVNSNVNESLYSGLSDGYNQQYLIWNAFIGYKFLKNRSLEARVTAFDILNQNKSIDVSVEDIYREQTNTRVLTQYLLFNLNYTFRHFRSGEMSREDVYGTSNES